MQGRSWMAALTIAASLAAAAVTAGEGDKPSTIPGNKPPASAPARAPAAAPGKPEAKAVPGPANAHTVKLDLKIAGLTPKGCDVEIKAAHAGCKFKTRKEHVDSRGMLVVELDDVEILNADRDCSFAITIREAGQTEKTWRRGIRVNATNSVAQILPCYLSSPSRLARASEAETKTKR